MQIIEVNHKTAANLLKKSVEKYWLDDNNDAYIRFTDGCVVCIHVLKRAYDAYVALKNLEEHNSKRFADEQSIYWFEREGGDGSTITDRTVSMNFDRVRYYYHRQFNGATRQYIPVIEFHYYEKEEGIGNHS